jgi:transcriptional repressor NrdR
LKRIYTQCNHERENSFTHWSDGIVKCPSCQHNGTRVLDSRPVDEAKAIRRRRECEECNFRFTTFEKVEEIPLIVVKKEGTREEFNRDKVLRGLIKACEKRPVALKELEDIVNEVEKELRSSGISEIKSDAIGEMVMDRLAKIDEVAYVRFASVYRQFKDINVFIDELKELIKREQLK